MLVLRSEVIMSEIKKGFTDWVAVKNQSEEMIKKAADTDPDAPFLTATELKPFKRVKSVETVDVKVIREKLHMTQEQFAYYFGVSVRTIQEWEQHRRRPTGTARNFLKIIALHPKMVRQALAG